MAIYAETVVALLVHLVGTCLLGYFVFSLFKDVFCSGMDRNAKGDSFIFWGSVICIVFFAIREFTACLFFMIIAAKGEHHSPVIDELLYLSEPFYGFALWIMLLCFVFRIHFSFTGNYVSYSRSVIIFLYFGAISIFIIIIVLGIININNLWDEIGGRWIIYVAIFIYFTETTTLVYVLFRKVFVLLCIRYKQLIESTTNDKELKTIDNSYTTTVTDNANGDNGDDLDVISLNNIKYAIRFALLICSGILSTYITLMLIMVDLELELSQNLHIFTWKNVFEGIDVIVNALVVYLMFTFTANSYWKCCGICQRCCEICCLRCMLSVNGEGGNQDDTQQYAELVLAN